LVVGEWVWFRRRVDVGDVVGAWARRIAWGDGVRVGAWSLLASGCGFVGEWMFGGVRCRRVGVRCLVGGAHGRRVGVRCLVGGMRWTA
jgi:hypothetical protein